MATFKRVPLSSIFVGDRIRPIDEDISIAIAASMAERGAITPISIRSTPARKGTPYTLVAGGRRYRAHEINGWDEIDAVVVEADNAEAQLIEIAENLYRDELNALDRAIFVMKHRELWEEKHGKIDRTRNLKQGDKLPKCNDCTSIFSPGKELSERVQEQLGFGKRTYFNVTKIGQKLHPALRNAVRGLAAERDQSKLLQLCKLSADDQVRIAAALTEHPDLDLVMSFLKPAKPAADPQEQLFERMRGAWDKADPETRGRFLAHIGIDPIEYGEEIYREAAE